MGARCQTALGRSRRGWGARAALAGLVCCTLAACGAAGQSARPAEAGDSARLVLLHVNDVYEITRPEGAGGLAELMTLLEEERARSTHTLTTFGGDLLSPSLLSSITGGEHMIALTNALGVEVAVLGNHEFDFGAEVLEQRIASSAYAWLGTNVVDAEGAPWGGTVSVEVRTFGAFKVGLFGVLTPQTRHLARVPPQIHIAEVIPAGRQAVETLRAAGCDVVIGLTHLSEAEDQALAKAIPEVDVLLGGHDHDPLTRYNGRTLLHKSGHDADYLGVIELELRRVETEAGPKVSVFPSWQMRPTRGVTPHKTLAKALVRYEQLLDRELGQTIGKTEVSLDGRNDACRTEETALGNLVADAMRAGAEADLALIGGGSIRGDRVIDPGVVTRRDVLSMFPFGNKLMVVEVTGAQLRAILEHGVSKAGTECAGRFPQVSGLRFSYDPTRAAGDRVVAVEIGTALLNPTWTYTLAVTDYLATGGDAYAMLEKVKRIIDEDSGRLLATVIIDYIAARTPVAPKLEGRIRELEPKKKRRRKRRR